MRLKRIMHLLTIYSEHRLRVAWKTKSTTKGSNSFIEKKRTFLSPRLHSFANTRATNVLSVPWKSISYHRFLSKKLTRWSIENDTSWRCHIKLVEYVMIEQTKIEPFLWAIVDDDSVHQSDWSQSISRLSSDRCRNSWRSSVHACDPTKSITIT